MHNIKIWIYKAKNRQFNIVYFSSTFIPLFNTSLI